VTSVRRFPPPVPSLTEGVVRPHRDAVTFLTVYVVLLLAIPSQLVFAPLGSAGSPAQLWGLALLVWWVLDRAIRARRRASPRIPVRLAMVAFVVCVLISYVVANVRPIDGVELRGADRGVLLALSLLGVVLVSIDGIPTMSRFDALLRRLAVAGGLMAALGILQYLTKQGFTNYIQIPGLSVNTDIGLLASRAGVARPAGTAIHPIEFGAVLTMLLPLALHYALEDSAKGRLRRWLPVVAIAFAIPISISRSAVLGAAIALAVLVPTWAVSRRRYFYGVMAAFTVSLYVALPEVVATLRGAFLGVSTDSSALSRTNSYDFAGQLIERSPILGRGFGTFLPAYRILDNQYLGVAIELGLVGLVALLTLFIVAMKGARSARANTDDHALRQQAQAIVAALAAGALSFAFFDAFAFPMAACLMFLFVGLSGALLRLTKVAELGSDS